MLLEGKHQHSVRGAENHEALPSVFVGLLLVEVAPHHLHHARVRVRGGWEKEFPRHLLAKRRVRRARVLAVKRHQDGLHKVEDPLFMRLERGRDEHAWKFNPIV